MCGIPLNPEEIHTEEKMIEVDTNRPCIEEGKRLHLQRSMANGVGPSNYPSTHPTERKGSVRNRGIANMLRKEAPPHFVDLDNCRRPSFQKTISRTTTEGRKICVLQNVGC